MAKLSVDQALLRAKGLARKGQIAEARRQCLAIIEAYPNNKRAKTALSRLETTGPATPDLAPPQEVLARLSALISQGKPEVAAAEAERLSKNYPNVLAVWNLFGAASAEAGKYEQAEEAFRRTVTLEPNHAEAHRNLGKILINTGKLEEATEACKHALRIRPDYLEALNTLGNALSASGRFDEAAAAYLRALKIQPNYAEVLYNLGNTLQRMDKADKAIQVYQRALKIQPDFSAARRGLGLALLIQGQTQEAISVGEEAVDREPDSPEPQLLLANALRQDGQTDAALAAVRRALVLAPSDAEAHNDLGITFQAMGRLDDAIGAFKTALENEPDYVQGWINLGVASLGKGDRSEAVAAYETALQFAPDNAEAHRHLSMLKTFDADDPQLARMSAQMTEGNLADTDRCQLFFALAKATEDLDDHEQALAYLSEGNALRRKLLGYNISDDETQFAALKATADSLRAAALTNQPEKTGVTPVFILGMPRSGTTLIEQIVSAHSKVKGAGELALTERHGAALATGEVPATAEHLQAFRDTYLERVGKLSGGNRVVTDKMPLNFRYIALICAALPEAKIVHVKRDPAATCWSNFKQYFENRNLGYCCDLSDTVTYYRLYDDLMRVWSSNYGARLYTLDYDALTRDQEQVTRELVAHLGLEWEDDCLHPHKNARAVATASQQQVRQAIYSGSSDAWRKFKPYLDGAFDALTPGP